MRDTAGKVCRRMILVAYGVTLTNQRCIVAYQLAQGESEAAWVEFLQDLFLRGLEGKHLQLIISDGSKGLRAALPVVFPRAPLPLCSAPNLRHIPRKSSPHHT